MTGETGGIVVLGAGPTGLGAAWRLHELGRDDWLILEAAGDPGGLASSVVDEKGFTWDLGGHVQFSHYACYDEVLDRTVPDWLWHERESWVWIKERFVPYPFQYNVHRLDEEDRERILAGLDAARLAAANAEEPPAHFQAWIERTFGEGLSEVFMLPYNHKVWGQPLENMAWNWIGERVAVPDVDRIRRNIANNSDDVSWGPNSRFRFPERGGTGAIWTGVAERLPAAKIRYGAKAVSVDLDARTITLEGGETVSYGSLLSTMPVDRFTRIAGPLSEDARAAGAAMVYGSVHVLGVGLRGGKPDSLAKKCWMYFPEDHSPYYRVTVFSHYSPFNVPQEEGMWSLMAEVCETPHKPVDADALKDWTLTAMRRDGLIEPDAELVSFWHRRLEHGYPVPFLGRDDALARIHPELEARGVCSRGRFGGWKYEVSNQDHGFMQGVEWVNRILHGEPEVTYPDPARANSGEFLKSAE